MNPSSHLLGEKLRRLLNLLFHGLIFTIPLLWTAQTSELFEFPKMMAVYVFTVLIAAAWLARMVVEGKVILRSTYLDIPLGLFLASQIISTIFSIDPHTSLWGYYSRFNGGLMSTVCYLLLYYAFVSNLTAKQAKHLVTTLLVTGVLISFYAFPEHFGHSPSCLKVTGQFNASCWVQDVQTRVFGTFGQPNWLAAYLITIIFLSINNFVSSITYYVSREKQSINILPVILNTVPVILFFSVLLFTKSRSGFLGLAIGLGIFTILSLIKGRHGGLPLQIKTLASCFLILALTFLVFGRGALPQTDIIFTIFNQTKQASPAIAPVNTGASAGTQLENGGTESGDIRRIVWQGALDLWKKYPLFGSGVETFAYGYYNTRPVEHNLVSEWDFLYNKAHNEFLNYLATTGLFGLLSYLSIMVVYLIWTIKKAFSPHIPDPKSQTQYTVPYTLFALMSGYLALAVSNYFGFSTVPVALLFFLFPALALILNSPDPIPQSLKLNRELRIKNQESRISHLQTSFLVILFLTSGFLLLRLLSAYQADIAYAQGKRLGDSADLGGAIQSLQKAVKAVPNEPLYLDELSLDYTKAALSFQSSGDASQAAYIGSQAELLSNQVISMNHVHLNYYKTRARIFAALASINSQYIIKAQTALEEAIKLAPTDAKLWFNLGLLHEQIGQTDIAQNLYEKTLVMKPNYEAARQALGTIYDKELDPEKATEQFRYILEYINPSECSGKSIHGHPLRHP